MKGSPDFQTAFNLMLCLYALGDKIRMKDCFASMLSIEIPGFTEE
jgi:intraflagellar transport protein 88